MKNAPKLSNLICVFDGYFNSIKTSARMQRAESSGVPHNLLLDMPTPQKQVILSVTKTKFNNSPIIAGVINVPVQNTHDLKNNQM